LSDRVAAGAVSFAKILFFIFLGIFFITLVAGIVGGREPPTPG
jgi:uncharacterized membrane protein YtjA (UPF0391 family)